MEKVSIFETTISRFLNPIESLLGDSSVSEILINGPDEIWVEKGGVLLQTEVTFPSSQSLSSALTNISQYCGRPYNEENPILETHLPDGSRLEAVMSPVAKNGPTVSIRRFNKKRLTVKSLIENGTLTEEASVFLARAISRKANIIVSGGTGSGKTSLLCALSSFFPENERIVVIEDTHELDLQQPHVVYLETRSPDREGKGEVAMRELLRATLRLRPDRIVVGEVRGSEAQDLVQAMTSGHAGSMTTVHANCPVDALGRLETMYLYAGDGLPHFAIRSQLASATDIVVQVARHPSGKRIVGEVSMVESNLRQGNYTVIPLFTLDTEGVLIRRSAKRRKQ